MNKIKKISGNIVNILNKEIFPGTIIIKDGKITDIKKDNKQYENYILPGFIDSHIHIESSMLTPVEFSRIATVHGTVATVSDPHEIANILGVNGVKYMIENGKKTPLKFYFSAPSCVPATKFETSGATIGPKELEELLKMDEIKYIGEVMNFPGVINDDKEILQKIELTKKYGKLLDGHAPGLTGEDLKKYVGVGISTDHECFTKEEALEKIKLGMKVQIREGSAVQNFDDLIEVVGKYYKMCMFCSDDKHPDDLVKGHINDLVKRALKKGLDLMKVLQVACVNPVKHYGLDVGLLQKWNLADFIVIDNFEELNILKTVIGGQLVAENGKCNIPKQEAKLVNNFHTEKKHISDFIIKSSSENINVIQVVESQLITNKLIEKAKIIDGNITSDIENDILKIVVVNRYKNTKPAIGFINKFNLKKGAIASSVAHDSHNIIAVGTNDEDICEAVNLIISKKGGVSAVCQNENIKEILPLPIAGIISDQEGTSVAEKYTKIDKLAKDFGSKLKAPYMTLSFMALLVIPEIKLSDKGLFDGIKFEFMEVGNK